MQLSISDFVVHSDKADYKYMGKGISEMIAVELRKSPGIKLIEREKRTDLLKEMEIALSDLADSQTQLEVGKLLAARYMVYGEIIDMGKKALISLRMIDVESGEVIRKPVPTTDAWSPPSNIGPLSGSRYGLELKGRR